MDMPAGCGDWRAFQLLTPVRKPTRVAFFHREKTGLRARLRDAGPISFSRVAVMRSTTSDGRKLLVELLHSVHGLDRSDMIAETLQAEGIKPAALVPQEFAQSTLERIRRAYEFQMRPVESERKRRGYGYRP